MRQIIEPTEKPSSPSGIEFQHPSFGLVRFSRVTGGRDNLFGSSISHQNFITLTISQGSLIRDLSCDRYYPRKELIQVEMSENQFAQLVSSMSSGCGIPCTIRSTESNDCVPSAPPISERQRINDEFAAHMREVAEKLQHAENKIVALLSSKTVTKGELREVQAEVSKATQHISSNIAFIHSQFNEACDNTVTEARAEVESAFHALIGRLGNEKLIEMAGVTVSPELTAIEYEEKQ